MRTYTKLLATAFAGALALTIAPTFALAEGTAVASVGDTTYDTLQKAIDADGEVTLLEDVTLDAPVTIKPGATEVINGADKTITIAGGAAFNYFDESNLEGLASDTSLTVKDVTIASTIPETGHATVTGINASGVDVAFNGCTFEGLYDAVYANHVSDAKAEANTITISGCTFDKVAHIYGVDDGATAGARVDKLEVTLDNNTGTENMTPETFAVASVDGVGYKDLQAALDAVEKDGTVELLKDVATPQSLVLATDGVTINGNGHKITAASEFEPNAGISGTGASSLLTITGNGCTVENVSMVGTANTTHLLNIWAGEDAKDVTATVKDVTLNHSGSKSGVAVVVNHVNVTVDGAFDVTTGTNSWGGVNLDNKYGATNLNFAENANPVLTDVSGKNLPLVYVENSGDVVDELPTITSDNPNIATDIDENGISNVHVHTTELQNAKDATCTAEGYTGDEVCTVCGTTIAKGEKIAKLDHKLELQNAKDATVDAPGYTGDQVCTVCGQTIVKGEVIPALPAEARVMYRLYNKYTGEHFYTSNTEERTLLVGLGWTDEGIAWVAPGEGEAVYRLFNPYADDHHFTMNEGEYESLQKLGWVAEGVAWYSADAEDEGAYPLYRLFNPYEERATHLYTADQEEYDVLETIGWMKEGIAWYGLEIEEK